jgi:hypothetical protein
VTVYDRPARLQKPAHSAQDRPVKRASLIVRSLWAVCLLAAGLNHVLILVRHGPLWDYGGVGWASAAYWSALTLFDPLVAALLFVRPRFGIAGTILLVATNVVHNLAITARHAPEGEFLARAGNPFVLAQIGFLLFVAATARVAWKGAAGRGAGEPG